MGIRPVEVDFFHVDGQTNGQREHMTKLIVAFRNFAKAPVNVSVPTGRRSSENSEQKHDN
jgi:hypothetical protein